MKKTIVLGDYEITVDVKEAQKPCSCTTRRAPQPRYAAPQPCREPKGGEGIMVAVQKPQPQFYENSWRGDATYRDHLQKYRNLENAAKACTWPNDMIDNGGIKWPVPQTTASTQPYGYPTPQRAPQRTVAQWSEPCACTRQTKEVRSKAGRVPCGAVVVGHTWNGEPVFDR